MQIKVHNYGIFSKTFSSRTKAPTLAKTIIALCL